MSLSIGNKPSFYPARQPLPDTGGALKAAGQRTNRGAQAGGAQAADGFVDMDADVKAQMQELFKEQFGAKARDAGEFHSFMKQVFGDSYDARKAEQYRQMALKGDFSFLPPIEFVSSSTLGGANGAYNAEAGVVYINSDLKNNVGLAARTYVEEAGHHLDTKLNKADTRGDEGEMFRRVLSGEKLSAAQMREIRAENDKGVITVDGKQVEVEFWNPFKAIGKAFKSIGKAIGKAAKGVWNGIKSVGEGIWKGVKSVGEGLWNGAKSFVKGIGRGVGGFVVNLFQGNFGEAFEELGGGLKEAFFDAPAHLVKGALRGVQHVVNGGFNAVEDVVDGATYLLGPLGKPVRAVTSRVLDAVRGIGTGVVDAATGVVLNVIEGADTMLNGAGKILTGDFKGGFKDLGMGLLKGTGQALADAVIMVGGRAISAVQTVIGLEPPGRRLTGAEIAMLKEVYGDSIDYDSVRIKEGFAGLFSVNDAAFTHGNTIYIKSGSLPLTDDLLAHEMAHVWQHQNGGTDYMTEAIYAQNWGDGYDWEKGVDEGKSWSELNPEQQAELIQDAVRAGIDLSDPNATFVSPSNGRDYSAVLQAALAQIRAGRGAP
ncbi:MAG: DUF4157 domain-containing protein [Phycisphaerae bacterium]